MRIYENFEALIGHTPLVRLSAFGEGLGANLLAKAEWFNPAGSVKDRTALFMADEAEQRGALKKGGTIVEPTSGNTGIALAALAARRGYRAVIVMPASASKERVALLKAYGAKVVLTKAEEGMRGAIEQAKAMCKEIAGSVLLGQFENPANPLAHRVTGREIWEDSEGNVACFVAGVGTGGTVTGAGGFLKERNPNIKVVAVEPRSSPVLSEGRAGAHKIQGIGAGFFPPFLDTDVVDEVLCVSDEEAKVAANETATKEGLLVGYSAGAALAAAKRLARRKKFEAKNIVVLLPDTGERYLSTDLFCRP